MLQECQSFWNAKQGMWLSSCAVLKWLTDEIHWTGDPTDKKIIKTGLGGHNIILQAPGMHKMPPRSGEDNFFGSLQNTMP